MNHRKNSNGEVSHSCTPNRPRFTRYCMEEALKNDSYQNVLRPVFSVAEFANRLALLRRHMREQNLDLCILTSMHNIKYLTNFLYCSFGRSYALVVSSHSITLISPGIDSFGPQRMIMRNGHKNQWNIIYTDWNRSNFLEALKHSSTVFDAQTDKSVSRRIGIEHDHMNIKLHAQILACCFKPTTASTEVTELGTSPTNKGTVLVDVSVALMLQRLVKSTEELKLIEAACKIANLGCETLLQTANIGHSEVDIAHYASAEMKEEIALWFPGTEFCDTWVWMQSGVNTDGAHNAVTSKKLEHGDLLSFNCFPMVDGYYVAIERTSLIVDAKLLYVEYYKLTEIPAEVAPWDTEYWKRKLFASNFELLRQNNQNIDWILYYWKINIEVFEKGRDILVAGAVVGNIAKKLNKIYEKYGVLEYRTFGYGHSFGILCHYYGREVILEIREDNNTVLKPGMIVSMEPHITVPQGLPGAGGYREHDILLITETGNRNLTNYKYGPEEMIIFSTY